jgi:hypothetical protein
MKVCEIKRHPRKEMSIQEQNSQHHLIKDKTKNDLDSGVDMK